SGISLRGQAEGRVPTDDYKEGTPGRKLLKRDIANLLIGQGDTLVTPLQIAQAIGIIANGGKFYQTRLVRQVQSIDQQIVTGYETRAKRSLDVSPETMEQVRIGMTAVVDEAGGTGHSAKVDCVEIA